MQELKSKISYEQLAEAIKLALRQENVAVVKNQNLGIAEITSDDCTTMSFTVNRKSYKFFKIGKDSWVETIKYSHRNETYISVSDDGVTNSDESCVPTDIHDTVSDDFISDQCCVDGIVTAKAGKVKPVTDLDKTTAEKAVREAGRKSAIANAESKCNSRTCPDKDSTCTFAKKLEAVSITSVPSFDSQGRVVWTATLEQFQVIGSCVCETLV